MRSKTLYSNLSWYSYTSTVSVIVGNDGGTRGIDGSANIVNSSYSNSVVHDIHSGSRAVGDARGVGSRVNQSLGLCTPAGGGRWLKAVSRRLTVHAVRREWHCQYVPCSNHIITFGDRIRRDDILLIRYEDVQR